MYVNSLFKKMLCRALIKDFIRRSLAQWNSKNSVRLGFRVRVKVRTTRVS
jgi:hypothetical protein